MIAETEQSGVPNTTWLGPILRVFHTDPDSFNMRCQLAAASKNTNLLLRILRQKEAGVSDCLAEIQAMEEAEIELAKTNLPPEPILKQPPSISGHHRALMTFQPLLLAL